MEHVRSGQYGLRKSAVHRHRGSHLPARLAQGGGDLKADSHAARQADRWHYNQLRKNARAAVKAFEDRGRIGRPEEWQAACEDARQRYQSGRFLLERLGAERFLDPPLMATPWQLRQGLIEEYGAESPAMAMVIDAVIVSYYNLLKIQAWTGVLALVEDALKVKLRQRYGTALGLSAVLYEFRLTIGA